MARGYHDLLKRQHKFGAQDETLTAKVKGRLTGSPEDLIELEISVRSILVSLGKPCRVSEFEKEYKQIIGKKFPVSELGLSSAVEVLKKISGACEIQEEFQADPLIRVKSTQKNAHILDLVKKSKKSPKPTSEQKSTLSKDVFIPFNVQDAIRCLLYGRRSIRKTELYKKLGERFDLQYLDLDVPIEVLVRSLPHLIHSDGNFVKSAYKVEKYEIEIPEVLHFKGEHIIPSYRLGRVELQISNNISALLTEKKSIQVMDVPHYYSQKFGKELNWQQFGFQDLWRFLQLLPGDFCLFKLESGYIVAVPDVVIQGAIDIRDLDERNFCGDSVYEKVLQKINRLVLHVNTGLNANYLKSVYETMYYERLVIRTDFHEFLTNLHEVCIFKMKEIGDMVVLFPCDIHAIEEERLKQDETRVLKLRKHSMDVMRAGDSLKNVDFQAEISAQKLQLCAACVTFIETPNKFYIRIAGINVNDKIELEEEFISLKDDMQECYKECSEEYDIPLSELKMEMVCAACVKGEWQRVTVLDIVNTAYVLIRSVDYGECHKVTLANLKYLPKEFSKLPVMAYKATLFNIQSIGMNWSIEAILDFRSLTADFGIHPRELTVLIVHRNKKGLLHLALTDVRQNEETHIGDELVNRGHAAYRFENEAFSAFYS